jgi:hypothetical protein
MMGNSIGTLVEEVAAVWIRMVFGYIPWLSAFYSAGKTRFFWFRSRLFRLGFWGFFGLRVFWFWSSFFGL